MTRRGLPIMERVGLYLDVADCWTWTGAVTEGGYGRVRYGVMFGEVDAKVDQG